LGRDQDARFVELRNGITAPGEGADDALLDVAEVGHALAEQAIAAQVERNQGLGHGPGEGGFGRQPLRLDRAVDDRQEVLVLEDQQLRVQDLRLFLTELLAQL